MNPEESNIKDIEHLKDKVKIIFSSIALAILFLVELYLMINSPANYIAIALFGVLILGDLYFLISSLIAISYRRDLNRREQYDGIYKAEKASYMIFRKYFDSLAQTLSSMDDKLEMPAEEIISAQKAVAKVTINRSKENTDALMNSNDKLIEKLFEFQDLLSENNEKLLEKTAEVNSQSNKENEMRQAELTSKMREMELSIKNEIYQTINQMALSGQFASAGPVVNPAPSPAPEMPEMFAESVAPISETADEQLAAMMAEEEPVADDAVQEELPVMEDLPSFDELPIDELGVPEDLAIEEPVAEEIPVMEEPVMEEIPAVEEVAEPEPEPVVEEPVVEEAPPMPDLSDPNKMMSPDDIAALLANMGGDSAPAEEPAPEPEPVAEEKPPMPDLSDPNKTLSPDEIEALFANL